MIDIGLTSFLEKVEERFGRIFATCLLALICIGVAAFFLNLTVTMAIRPSWEALSEWYRAASLNALALVQMIYYVFLILFFAVVAAGMMNLLDVRRDMARWKVTVDEIEETVEYKFKSALRLLGSADEIENFLADAMDSAANDVERARFEALRAKWREMASEFAVHRAPPEEAASERNGGSRPRAVKSQRHKEPGSMAGGVGEGIPTEPGCPRPR